MTSTIANHIAASTHVGVWTQWIKTGAHRADSFTAAELAGMLDGEFVVWESAGTTVREEELFVRSRLVSQSDGSLAGYDANGRHIITHPADRALRILTR
jgi:hypothetical protein